jgi:prepilin-type N-terminal cleavage/methylation domain-containing protein
MIKLIYIETKQMKIKIRKKRGFTLLEILLVIAAIGVLAAIVLIAINPNKQIAQARNAQRRVDLNTLNKSLEQILIDTGTYPTGITSSYQEVCATGRKSSTDLLTDAPSVDCTGKLDLRTLIPTYIASMPRDPQSIGSSTGYYVARNSLNNKISIKGANGELSQTLAINDTGESVGNIPIVYPQMWVSRLTTAATVGSASLDAEGNITMTSDGGSYQVFHFYQSPSTAAQLAIVRRDATGVVLWSKFLSPSIGNSLGLSGLAPVLAVGANNDLFISLYFATNGNSIPVWALDNQGNIKWQKNFLRNVSSGGGRRVIGMKYNASNDSLYVYGSTSDRDGYIAKIASISGNIDAFRGFTQPVRTSIQDIVFSGTSILAVGIHTTNQGFVAELPLDISTVNSINVYSASSNITFMKATIDSLGRLFIVGNGDGKLWAIDSGLNLLWGRNLAANANVSGTIDFTNYNNKLYLAGRAAGTTSVPGYSGWTDGRVQALSTDGTSILYDSNSRALTSSSANYQYAGTQNVMDPVNNRFIETYSSQNATSGFTTIAVGHQIEMPAGVTSLAVGGGQFTTVGARTVSQANTLITDTVTRSNPSWPWVVWNASLSPNSTNMTNTVVDASSILQWQYYSLPPATSFPTPISATYSQSSVYVTNQAADQATMTNNIVTESLRTATNSAADQFIRMDFGSAQTISKVVVGADLYSTLAGGWNKSYTENKLIQVSTDNVNWTTVANTGTFNLAMQVYSITPTSARYVRLYTPSGYISATEFYAGNN